MPCSRTAVFLPPLGAPDVGNEVGTRLPRDAARLVHLAAGCLVSTPTNISALSVASLSGGGGVSIKLSPLVCEMGETGMVAQG